MDIFKTNGIKLTSIADGTVDTLTSPLSLPSRNVSGYGKVLNENLVRLLENFADITPPANGLLGQLWFDTESNQLYVNSSLGYRPLTVSYKTVSEPENTVAGDIWWDAGKKQLKVFDGSNWIVIGPDFENSWGETGWFSSIVRDTLNIDHLITRLKIGGQDRLIINQDSDFTPSQSIEGFGILKTGINVTDRIPNFLYNSTVENSNKLGGIASSIYLRNDQDSQIDGKLTVDAIDIGTNGPVTLSVVGEDKELIIANPSPNSSIKFELLVNGNATTVLSLNNDGQVLLASNPINPQSAANKGYVDVKIGETQAYIDSKFSDEGALPIEIGGTGAKTIDDARTNLRVPSREGRGAFGLWNIDITGLAEEAKLSQDSQKLNGFVESTGAVTDTIARRDSSGDLTAVEFIGIAVSARYADLAEKYLTDRDYEPGTVVMVGGEKEMTACVAGSRAIGAVSANPAYKMNNSLQGGQYIALKGRLQIRVVGPVKKGDMLIADNDGCAKSVGKSNIEFGIFAVALEDDNSIDVKLVECLVL